MDFITWLELHDYYKAKIVYKQQHIWIGLLNIRSRRSTRFRNVKIIPIYTKPGYPIFCLLHIEQDKSWWKQPRTLRYKKQYEAATPLKHAQTQYFMEVKCHTMIFHARRPQSCVRSSNGPAARASGECLWCNTRQFTPTNAKRSTAVFTLACAQQRCTTFSAAHKIASAQLWILIVAKKQHNGHAPRKVSKVFGEVQKNQENGKYIHKKCTMTDVY